MSVNTRPAWRRTAARLTAAAVIGSVLVALPASGSAQADTAPVAPITTPTVSADVLPTAQIGTGVVWDQVIVGTTVYVAGEFSVARPPGAAAGVDEVPRANLLAYDLTTGALLPWAPAANGSVRTIAASADGTRIYVGGTFTTINGVNRYRLAAVDAATGATVAGFQANVQSRVNDVQVAGDVVYLGGLFSVVANQPRSRLAAVSASNGALLAWAPSADAEVIALTAPAGSGKVVVGGRFAALNGVTALGLGAVDSVTGATLPFAANTVIRDYGANDAIWSLENDGQRVYGSGYSFSSAGNLEGTFAARVSDGGLDWITGCRGDTYDVAPVGDVLYHVGHMHDCSQIGMMPEQIGTRGYQRAAAHTTAPAANQTNASGDSRINHIGQAVPQWLHWTPDLAAGTYTGQDQGAWSVEATADYVTVAGEFPSVNGVPQQGLARFARRALAPNAEGPKSGQDLVPAVDTSIPGSVRLTWRASWDRDNQDLSYQVLRGASLSTATVIGAMRRGNGWYDREGMSFVDAASPAGSTQTYRVRVTDPLGNVLVGNPVTATVPAGTPTSPAYPVLVRADGAIHHWRLGEASGSVATDWAGTDNLALISTATRGAAGAIGGDADPASTFAGATGVPATGGTLTYGPRTVSVEAWIRTTTTRGGKIVGFGSSRTGTSSTTDRHVYMTNSGQLAMGAALGGVQAVALSPNAYNDGAWHHVVGSIGRDGVQLHVDGALVASSTARYVTGYYRGYWRVAGDNLTGWPNRPTSNNFAGSIDEVAVYYSQLTADQVAAHWNARLGQANQPPTAAFSSSGTGRTISFDAGASADFDGSIASYAWDFGDGTTATGATASHTYPDVAATYPVTLTVTDDKGATATATRDVTVTPPPNTAPTSSFTATSSGLITYLDGRASVDPDGSLAGYAWDLGDGTTASTATVTHTYAAAGTYPVTLVVTDNRGAQGTSTQQVTVAPVQAGQTVAADTFTRDVASGLGAAETGGPWTVGGSGGTTAVTAGSAAVTVNAGKTITARLGQVSSAGTETAFTTWTEAMPTGGGAYLSGIVRATAAGDYRVRVRITSTGAVSAAVTKMVGSTETLLSTQVAVPGVTYAVGTKLRVRAQVTGTDPGPSTIRYRVWADGAAEPTTWLQTVSDSSAGLQSAGSVGLVAYLSASATAPLVVRFDDLAATSL